MTAPLFPDLVESIPDLSPVPCANPLFIVAYYPPHGRWAIKCPLEPNQETVGEIAIHREIQSLLARGWTHITVMRLPDGGPWSETK